jgi:hypothetical protein
MPYKFAAATARRPIRNEQKHCAISTRQADNDYDKKKHRGSTMIRTEFRKSLLDQHGAVVILWVVFVPCIFLYITITQIVLANPKFSGTYSFSGTVRLVLWLLVLIDIGYLAWWKKNYLAREVMSDNPKNMKLLRALEGHDTPLEERAATLVSAYVTRKVVVFAIIEAIAVYGLVLALVGRYLSDQYLFSAASVLLLVLEFPSKHFLEGLVNEIETHDPG